LDDPSVVRRCVSMVEGLREVIGTDIIPSAVTIVQPYRSGPAAFRSRLISPSVPSIPGLDIFVGVLPKVEVAADFFEIVPLKNRLALAIGDAPSVGIKSAFVARFLGNLFCTLAESSKHLNLSELLATINSKIAGSDYFERISMQCADIDPTRGLIHLANAGHPYPVRYSARRAKCDILPLKGDLLHNPIASQSRFQFFEQYGLEIEPGDILVFITDGLTEGHLLKGDPFGYRFTQIIEASAQESARTIGERVLDAWKAHPRDEDTADDVSVVVVKLHAGRGAHASQHPQK
jgi:serine phosphatase RsbU (regulator of sigma subunit)